VLPLVALLLVAIAGLTVAVGDVGLDVVTAARARAAADAAALAGAADGEAAARRMALANGATLVDYATAGQEVQVTVAVAGVEARARAARRADRDLGGASGAGLTAAMRAAIDAAEEALGRPLPVTSGWRSPAAQQALWERRASNPYPVARPGTSAHERGTAIDVPRALADALAAVGPSVGLCRPLPTTDPVHFELCQPTERPR
jgi:uncharacterized protein YcbK (DUF882 family)